MLDTKSIRITIYATMSELTTALMELENKNVDINKLYGSLEHAQHLSFEAKDFANRAIKRAIANAINP